MKDIMEIVKYLEESDVLNKSVKQLKQLKMKQKNKNVYFVVCY